MQDPTLATPAILWHFAWLRAAVKFARLREALHKAGYDPNQPRAPVGSSIGGQWVTAGTSERVRIAASAFDNPGLYYGDLGQEQHRGGHGFSKHVGKSNTDLIAYQLLWRMEHPGRIHPAEGSFNSLGEANNLVSQLLRLNADTVQRVIDGRLSRATLLQRFDFPTGREAFSPDTIAPFVIRSTFWVHVIIRRHQSPPGYLVLTAYPINDTPNEEFAR